MTRQEIRSRVIIELRRHGMTDYYDMAELDVMINQAKDEFSEDIGGFRGVASSTTTAGTERYKLPSRIIGFNRVEFDGEIIAYRIPVDAMKVITNE